MRRLIIALMFATGCTATGLSAANQASTGPGGVTVTPRETAGQLAVSWTADPVASEYLVFRSAGGGAFTFVANLSGGIAGPPATSYIDTGLVGGASYCYEVQSSYDDGTMSGLSAPGCGTATGSTPTTRARQISGLTVVPEWPTQAGGPGATRIANTWAFASQNWMYFPVSTNIGETLTGYQIYVFKGSSHTFAILSTLIEVDSASGEQSVVGGANSQEDAPGRILLGTTGLSRSVGAGKTYLIRIADGSGSAASSADSFTDATLLYH